MPVTAAPPRKRPLPSLPLAWQQGRLPACCKRSGSQWLGGGGGATAFTALNVIARTPQAHASRHAPSGPLAIVLQHSCVGLPCCMLAAQAWPPQVADQAC